MIGVLMVFRGLNHSQQFGCTQLTSKEMKTSTSEELSRKLNLIIKRLDTLEAIVLDNPNYAELESLLNLTRASLGLYANPLKMVADSKHAEQLAEIKPPTRVETNLSFKVREAYVGENVHLDLDLVNTGKTPVLLIRVENILPAGFELVEKPGYCHSEGSNLDMDRKRLDPLIAETIRLSLRSFNKGTIAIEPKIVYADMDQHNATCHPEPATIKIVETILPDRISTGYRDLDSLLFGGIPKNYAVVLTSPSCDERELLVKKFLQAGIDDRQITFQITTDLIGVEALAKETQSSFHLFICNPQADKIVETSPNSSKLKGVENLTDISIALNKSFRKLSTSNDGPRRACIEIVSDVLLQHKAVQTRRWLTDLIAELKTRGFTVLAVMNPQMHSAQEVQAIVGLFEGEISIYEKESEKGLHRFIKIKKMYNQRYLEDDLLLRKERLLK